MEHAPPPSIRFVAKDLWRVYWSRPLLAIALPVSFVTVAIASVFLMPKSYTAFSTLLIESAGGNRLPSGLGALAGQLGLSVGTEGTTSPRLFADLAASQTILAQVIQRPLPAAAGRTVMLLDYLRAQGATPTSRVSNGIERMARRVSTDANPRTGLISVAVTLQDPELAAAATQAIVSELIRFNSGQRQTSAGRRRQFIEGQLSAQAARLRSAEEAIRQFNDANRAGQSATILLERQRLARQVDLEQEVFLSLRRAFDAARIDEVNDQPSLTLVDSARVPIRPAGASTLKQLVFSIAVAAVLAIVMVVTWNHLRSPRT